MLLAFQLAGSGFFPLPVSVRAQTLEEAQDLYWRGNYTEVVKSAKKKIEDGTYRTDWRMLLVRTLLTLGRYDEAYTNATQGLNSYSSNIGMRLLARETALYKNNPAEANRRLAEIKAFLEQRQPSARNGEELVALGQALLLLGVEPRLVLENCFQQAQKMDSPPRSAFLAAGQLALEKHDYKLAADAFRNGLAKFPKDPDIRAGLAQAYEPGDREEMQKAIQAALGINPQHIPSLLLLADHLIDAEQYEEAEKQLTLVLHVNPHQPEALAYRAVLAHLKNNAAQEKQFREEALKYYQTNPQVDHLIGLKLSQKYRFAEGAAAQRRALEFEPDYLPARRQLAGDLLRLGQADEGWELAEAVHKEDGYDVTAYNLTTLRDQMLKFQTLSNADFIIRMSAHEAALYGDQVLDLMSRARKTLCAKYGVELTQPTTVEIFPEQKDFAVRTFGMPGNPGYLGVCFGPVITANSPASQAPNPANWEDVLWHEYTHVVTLAATKNRMPRWLSEGISVYEERHANPTWGEKMNLAYRDMILHNELTPLGKLSGAFLSPSNSVHLQFAYFESSLVVEFIVQRHGFETLKQILSDLRDGDEVNTSIAKRTAPLPEIEKQFAAFVRGQAEQLAPGVDLEAPPAHVSDLDMKTWELAHPKNFRVRLRKAVELMEARKWAEARPLLESLAEEYHGESNAKNPYWLLAETYRNLNDTNAELATLKTFAARESDFVELFSRLIELTQAQKDWPNVTKYATRLLAVNPLISLPHRALALAGMAMGKTDQAITAYRKLLALDPPDPVEIHYQLASLLHKRGDSGNEARRHVLQSLEDAPRFRDAQRLLLEITAKTTPPATTDPTTRPEPNP